MRVISATISLIVSAVMLGWCAIIATASSEAMPMIQPMFRSLRFRGCAKAFVMVIVVPCRGAVAQPSAGFTVREDARARFRTALRDRPESQ